MTVQKKERIERKSTKASGRSDVIAAVDVGTTKVACFIGQRSEEAVQIIGVGHHRSRGMRNGSVVNMDEVEASVRAAVDAAEQMANRRVDTVLINVSCGEPRSSRIDVEMSVAGHEVRDSDVKRLIQHGHGTHQVPDRDLLHCIPVSYAIDGGTGIMDPRGMYGDRLGVNIHVITAASGPVKNLTTAIERCHLEVSSTVASPYASGLACLVEEETELGVTVIDMGGGTTSVAVFLEGQVVFTETIPVGGLHVTNDLAKGLSTPVDKAERLKTVHGSVVQTPADARELLKVTQVGEEDEHDAAELPKSMLVQIIQPRLEETFELVRSHLDMSGYSHAAGRRVVLTGGASQLTGVRDLAELVLDKQVRLARPKRIKGLPDSVSGPAFSTCAGLLRFAMREHVRMPDCQTVLTTRPRGLGRIGQWLKENF